MRVGVDVGRGKEEGGEKDSEGGKEERGGERGWNKDSEGGEGEGEILLKF